VDFVVKQGTQVTALIQVCVDLESPKTKSREIRALLKAAQELRCKNLFVLTHSTEGKEDASWYGLQGTVRFVPVWRWLLQGG
jgi:hypothetical protein